MAVAHEYATQHDLRLVLDVMLKDEAAIHIDEALGCERLGNIEHRQADRPSSTRSGTEPAVEPVTVSYSRPRRL